MIVFVATNPPPSLWNIGILNSPSFHRSNIPFPRRRCQHNIDTGSPATLYGLKVRELFPWAKTKLTGGASDEQEERKF
jgi:hypothetical protein